MTEGERENLLGEAWNPTEGEVLLVVLATAVVMVLAGLVWLVSAAWRWIRRWIGRERA